MKTIIYIDGFNLYYGCLKNTPYKWLNLKTLFENILQPHNNIIEINYFTAHVKSTPNNPQAANRQQFYLRALETYIPEIHIHYGHFLRHKVRMAVVTPPPNTIEVFKTEEKGSDVNLAVHVLNDAWLDRYECAIIVSNDSDMAESIKLIKTHHPNKIIGLITPGEHTRTSEQLSQYADFVRKIRISTLRNSQLPNPIPNTPIRKPEGW